MSRVIRMFRYAVAGSVLAAFAAFASSLANGCTRALYVGDDGTVMTGRSMDWSEDMRSNLWVFPAGIERDGAAGPRTPHWTSKYGSVVVSGYEIGSVDGMNERGLVTNVLYLTETDYGKPDASRPPLSISLWAQYALDNFATVAEAVDALGREPFQIIAPPLPNGKPLTLHLALSDSQGDSAILEYLDGKLVIHHGKAFKIMTNSPIYSEQLALDTYWKGVGGLTFLPGTNRAADRFVRASFLMDAIPKRLDPNYIAGVPQQSYAFQAAAGGRDERDARRQCAARYHDAGPAEYLIDDLAHRVRPEESRVLLRFVDAARYVLGAAAQVESETGRARDEADHRRRPGSVG